MDNVSAQLAELEESVSRQTQDKPAWFAGELWREMLTRDVLRNAPERTPAEQ
jgi:hypothetical protein